MTESCPPPSDPPPEVRSWKKLSTRVGPSLRIFHARFDRCVNPRNAAELDAVVLQTPDWANVVALTPARELVLVRQYRFGIEAPTTEIPGGMVDRGEDPLEAARRELLEETGYRSERWTPLGSVQPNPAFHDNLCHHYLAEDCREVAQPNLDSGEDVVVFVRPVDQVLDWVRRGELRNSLVVCALARVFDLR